ncbi:MAG: V-type ATP synthase subunit E [Porcipelethomonas sp.]
MDELQAAKLERFTVSVNSEVDGQIKAIIDDAEKLRKEQLSRAEDEALLDAYNKIQKSVREIEGSCRREYALKQQSLKTDVLKHRGELIESIFSAVRQKIEDFTGSAEYESYLLSLADGEDAGEGTVIAVSPKDRAFSEKLEKKTGFHVETSDKIKLGGLEIIDSGRGIVIDKTLDSNLEEQRKNFSSRYSFRSQDGIKG